MDKIPQSQYTGVCVVKSSSGKILAVQVKDPFGNSIPIPPKAYRERGIKPPMESLPACNEGGGK